jgi:DsbC/DsbD-like thiol-disulfide interchange protein
MLIPVLLAALTPAPVSQPADTHHTKITIVAERPGLTPGGTVTLAFVFDMDKDWHIYWPGQNDTGQPPEIDASKLPAGFTLGPIVWPVPKRYVQPGDILDHIYEKKAVLLTDLSAPKDAKVGTTLNLEFPINWMECATECRLAEGVVKVSLPVVDKAPDASNKPLFEQARAAIPAALPNDSPIKVKTTQDASLTITAPDADRLTFLPHADSIQLTDLIKTGESKGGTLAADLALSEPAKPTEGIVGILVVTQGKTTTSWWIDTRSKTDSKQKSDPDPRPNPEPARTAPPR